MRSMSSTSLTIEGYAEIRAEMEAGRLRDEVLSRAGVTMDAWVVEQRNWLQKMATELERGRFELTTRYTQAFFTRQRALKERAQAPSPVPPAIPAPVAVAPAKDEDAIEQTLPPQKVAAPSAMPFGDLSQVAWLSRLPEGTSLETTLPLIAFNAPPKTLPFEKGVAPVDLAVSQPQKRERDAADDLSITKPLTPGIVPRGPALPFQAKEKEPGHDDHDGTLSLEAHAALCAKLALFPTDAELIFARYGLASTEKRKAVDEAWKERLREDPKLYEQWQQLYRTFYAQWRGQDPG
jgi:hypothetical protein